MARKILLADDSVTAQNMGRKILTDAGYDVVTVNNGSAALKRVAEIKPDLIVLDVYMPGYSGLEVCQRLKDAAETAHIPVLLTVGKLEPFKVEEGRRVRADSHIVKPFEASELLTAITRLEDRIVPQQSAGAQRSGKGTTGNNADLDTGWKSRLSFSSKKKKDEPEPAPDEATASAPFRDFRKAKGKSGANGSATLKTPLSTGQEQDLVSEVPRDITPEEMDALSALALKLNGETPPAGSAAKSEVESATASAKAIDSEAPAQIVEQHVIEPTIVEPTITEQKITEPAAAAVDLPAFAVEAPGLVSEGGEAKSEIEIPVECVELATDNTPAITEPVLDTHQPETLQSGPANAEVQNPEMSPALPVNASVLTQEPAPADVNVNDEPTFASFLSAPVPPARVKLEEKPSEAAHDENTSETITATNQEVQPDDGNSDQPAPATPYASALRDAVDSAPSDAELVEALRLLTPATGYTDVAAVPSNPTLAAAGQWLSEEARRDAAAVPRWVAEPMTLSPAEAAISLEAEMMLSVAAAPAASCGDETATDGRIVGVSAIAAAVDNRLTEAGVPPSSNDLADQATEAGSVVHSSVVTVPETVTEAPTPVMAVTSNSTSAGETETAGNVVSSADAVEEPPKAMAAAAAAERSASATDASTIASIVDSVMADLRPRIVAEIARKLAGK